MRSAGASGASPSRISVSSAHCRPSGAAQRVRGPGPPWCGPGAYRRPRSARHRPIVAATPFGNLARRGGSTPRPPSRCSPASPRSQPTAAKSPAVTGSTVTATDNSTARCTPLRCPASATTSPPAATLPAVPAKARPAARSNAAWSATSPASSTDSSKPRRRQKGARFAAASGTAYATARSSAGRRATRVGRVARRPDYG